MISVLIRRGRDSHHMQLEIEIEVMHLQAKEHQGVPATPRSWKRQYKFPVVPWSLQRDMGPVDRMILDSQPPEM